jgi:hypothetical protein
VTEVEWRPGGKGILISLWMATFWSTVLLTVARQVDDIGFICTQA